MAVFYLAARLRDVLHAERAEGVGLGVGCRLVVAVLVDGGEHLLVVRDDVVLQLAHSLKLHARHLLKGLRGLAQRVFRSTGQRLAVLVEERAQHRQRRYLGKGVQKSRAVAGQHVEVARAGLDEREEAGAVNALAARQDGVQVVQVRNDEVQRLQLTVATRVHKVHHADVVLRDVTYDVFFCEFSGQFLQESHHGIRIQCDHVLHNT